MGDQANADQGRPVESRCGGALRAGFARNPCLVPPPRFGEGVRGWGLGDAIPILFLSGSPSPLRGGSRRGWGRASRRARRPHPPGPPLRSGEGGARQKLVDGSSPDPSPRPPPRSGEGEKSLASREEIDRISMKRSEGDGDPISAYRQCTTSASTRGERSLPSKAPATRSIPRRSGSFRSTQTSRPPSPPRSFRRHP